MNAFSVKSNRTRIAAALLILSAPILATEPVSAEPTGPQSGSSASELGATSPRSSRPGRSGRGESERPKEKPAETVAVPMPATATETSPSPAVEPTTTTPPASPVPATKPAPAAVVIPTTHSDERDERRKRMEDLQRAAEEAERIRRDARYKELMQDQEDAGLGDNERRKRQSESNLPSRR